MVRLYDQLYMRRIVTPFLFVAILSRCFLKYSSLRHLDPDPVTRYVSFKGPFYGTLPLNVCLPIEPSRESITWTFFYSFRLNPSLFTIGFCFNVISGVF